MTKRELMIKAHKMTKEIKTQYPTINYKFQLGLCLSYLQKEGEVEMVELKGTEKQIKWAEDIREVVIKGLNALLDERQKAHEERGKKRTLRMLEETKETLNKIETEENSKYFIDNFNYILRSMEDYKIEAEVRNVDLELVVAYKIKNELGL